MTQGFRRIASLFAAWALVAGAASVVEAQTTVQFNLPAQPLADSLRAVGTQMSINVLFDPPVVADRMAPALQAQLTSNEAFTRLLAGTGLQYEFVSERTVAIREGREEAAKKTVGAAAGGDTSGIRVAGAEAMEGDASAGEQQVAPEDQEKSTAGALEELEEIVVTGTHIRGTKSASPLVVIDRAQIDLRGFSTTQQVLDSLPQNFGGGARPQSFFGAVPGDDTNANIALASSVSLRGIGSGSTLVLVNGHRFTTMGQGSFFDLGIIPISAIDRVEVLADGASTIYGSDAIAGVVNVILRKDFNGAETRVQAGKVTNGDQDQFNVSQTFGTQWTSGGGILALDYFDQSALSTASKDFINERIPDLTFAAAGVLDPKEEQKRVYASLHQEFSPRLRGTLDLLYSDKDSGGLYFIGLPWIYAVETEAFGAETGLDVSVNDSFQLRLNGGYTHADVTSRFRNLDPPASDADLSSSTWHIDAVLDGRLFSMPGGAAKIATGVSFREEKYQYTDVFTGTDFPADRSIVAIFAELNVPLLSTLVLTASGRYEDYADFGSTTDPKVGVAWSPTAALQMRATWGTSFRVATLDLQSRGLGSYDVSIQDVPNPFSQTGSSITGGIVGSARLGPERSKNWTAGVDFTPQNSTLRASLTYFRIDYSDRIARPAPLHQIVLANPVDYAPFVVHDPSQQDINDLLAGATSVSNVSGQPDSAITEIVDLRFRNLSTVLVDGFDLSGSCGWPIGSGQATLSLEGQYLRNYKQRLIPTLPQISVVDTVYNPTHFRGNVSGAWTRNGLSLTATYNYTDAYRNNAVVPAESISSYATTDVHIAYDFADTTSVALLSNLQLSLTGFNILDRDPPFANVFQFFDAANASSRGRFLLVAATKRW